VEISVIIPTFNRSMMIEKTLRSFLDQTIDEESYEIIVCDNNSTDDTKLVLDRLIEEFPKRIRCFVEKRQGVHYARNSAAKKSEGEILYFTDDDMIAEPDLLENLVKTFDFNPRIGSATGLVKPLFDKPPPKWVSKYLHNSWLSLTDKQTQDIFLVSEENCGIFSCHQAIRRKAFFESGGFNPENTDGVWVGDGETGLNLKIKELGYYFAYNSSSVIHHMIPPHRTTPSYLISRIGNQAYCDAYSEYRIHRNFIKHVFGMLKRNSFGLVRIYAGLVVKLAKDQISAIFLFAYIFYIRNRFIYDIKVLFKPRFRKIIEIDNWLEVDDELEIKI